MSLKMYLFRGGSSLKVDSESNVEVKSDSCEILDETADL